MTTFKNMNFSSIVQCLVAHSSPLYTTSLYSEKKINTFILYFFCLIMHSKIHFAFNYIKIKNHKKTNKQTKSSSSLTKN